MEFSEFETKLYNRNCLKMFYKVEYRELNGYMKRHFYGYAYIHIFFYSKTYFHCIIEIAINYTWSLCFTLLQDVYPYNIISKGYGKNCEYVFNKNDLKKGTKLFFIPWSW